jgi:hypothetical protein
MMAPRANRQEVIHVRTRPLTPLIGLVAAIVLALGLVGPAIAQEAETALARAGNAAAGARVLVVHHGPVDAVLADPASEGPRVGDVRTASVETTNAAGDPLGRLEATLLTTATDTPADGDEIRLGTLVFTFGERGQVVVQGAADYPAQGSTIAAGASTVRPIIGGSGRFAGLSGDAVSSHLDDGSWTHELRFRGPWTDRAATRELQQRARQGLREWHAQRLEVRTERQVAREERKAEREEGKVERKRARVEASQERNQLRAGFDDAVGQPYADAAADASGVVRTDLGIAEPGSAPGEQLGLWHYAIAAGEELAPHTHPGWQLARITSGELEYSVISGVGVLLRADGSTEPMGPGTYQLASGDGVIENPDLEHYGANRGEDVVTIISATLFEAGEPVATIIEEPAAVE